MPWERGSDRLGAGFRGPKGARTREVAVLQRGGFPPARARPPGSRRHRRARSSSWPASRSASPPPRRGRPPGLSRT